MIRQKSELSQWFCENLQPHAEPLRFWLRARFPDIDDLEDIVQEALLASLNAQEEGRLRSPKGFLYGTARNLAMMAVRSKRVRGGNSNLPIEEYEIEDDSISVRESVERNQELQILTKAIQSLPDRCRQVFTLRRVFGLSQAEIAEKLNLSKRTVNAQLTIGMHKCARYMERYREEIEG